MKIPWGVVAYLLAALPAQIALADVLESVGTIKAPICQDEVLSMLPSAFDVDIGTGVPPAPRCVDTLVPRQAGHLRVFGPKAQAGKSSALSSPSGSWRFDNLTDEPAPLACLPEKLAQRPVVMSCSPKDNASGLRKGLSTHIIHSLHDAAVDLAEFTVDVQGHETLPVLVAVEFTINARGPNFGPEYANKIREHFVLEVTRTDAADSGKTTSDSYIVDISLGRANRIVASISVPTTQHFKVQLSFKPIVERTVQIYNLQTKSSNDISLEVELYTFAVSRGVPSSSLHQAVRDNDLPGLRALIASHANLASTDQSGLTPLALGQWLGRRAIVAELLTLGAPDNRAAILAGPSRALLDVLQNGVPPALVVEDMMRRAVIVPPQPSPGQALPERPARTPNMRFTVNASFDTEGCAKDSSSFSTDEPNRIDTRVRIIECTHSNASLGLYAAFADLSSFSAFGAYRLATLGPETPEGHGTTVYTAHLLSGAYGGGIYEGVFGLGSSRNATARIAYSLNGTTTIPPCVDPSACAVYQMIWYSEKRDGDGYLTQVRVSQNGAVQTLSPDQQFQIDLSRGPATISVDMSREYSHLGSACCKNLQQNHFVSIRVAEQFTIPPWQSLLRSTHAAYGRPIGEEDRNLTVARADEIVGLLTPFLDRGRPGFPVLPPGLDFRRNFSELAQHHEAYSHPHSARYADILLRLALMDAVGRDPGLTAGERALMALARESLSNVARSLYLPETVRQFSALKANANGLRIKEAVGLAKEIDKGSGPPTVTERALSAEFFILAASGGERFARGYPALLANVQTRADLAKLLLSYVNEASKRLDEITLAARMLAIEISQFTSADPFADAERSLLELSQYQVN
jgi:hypothetical protein